MSISSHDILNLSHALKDVCEVDCGTCPALTNTLRTLAQINLIRAQLEFGRQLDCAPDGAKQVCQNATPKN